MIIAVNTRFLLKDRLEGYGYFIREVFRELALSHPQHQFYFLFDRPFDPEFIFSKNVIPLQIGPPARHPVLWKIWYDLRVSSMLKKIRAEVFVSPDGIASLTTIVPQCLVVHDIGILHFPKDYKTSHAWFYKKYLPRFIKKSDRVATVSEYSKSDIIKHYKTSPDKIDVVYSAAKEIFKPADLITKLSVKEKWTGGKDYFIYVGAIHPRKNLVNLLKAFSFFKKRQQSSMKLVLCGRMLWKNDEFLALLKTYKYRDEVVLTDYIDETSVAELVASAYALIYPSTFEGFGVPVLEAMKSGVPALTSKGTSMQEIGEDAGLYFDPLNYQDMADAMMMVYKDEELRRKLIEKGKIIAEKYSWKRTAELLWNSIMKAAESKHNS